MIVTIQTDVSLVFLEHSLMSHRVKRDMERMVHVSCEEGTILHVQ